MYLPDKIVIDLYEVNLIIDKIAKLLKNLIKFTKCGEIIDVGNDIEYSLKELFQFKNKLIDLIVKESQKYQSDIFGNTLKTINNYRYVEIMFSEDYKQITSIRLVGKDKENFFNRYALFNLENIFEPTVINLLFNSDEILSDFNENILEETKYLEFLQNYFAPFPTIHPLPEKNKKCLDNVSKKYDDGKPKTYEEVLNQTNKFGSLNFKMPIFHLRIPSVTLVNDLSLVLPEIGELINKIDTSQGEGLPGQTINIIQSNLLDKFKLPDIVDFIFSGLNLNIDPFSFLEGLPPVEIFEKIDELPKDARKKIYDFLRLPNGGINLDKLMIDLQEFMNFKLNLDNIDLDLSIALKNILTDFQKINIPQLITELPDLEVSQINLQDPNFKFTNPDILLKINKFENIFGNWDVQINGILDIFNNNPIIKNLPENGQIKNLIVELKKDLGSLKLQFPKLKEFNPNYNLALKIILDGLKNIKLPDILFNLDKFNNKKVKTKCNIKIPKNKFNYKLSNIFKKFKLKFPNFYSDFVARFNLKFPKFDFLFNLKNLINLDLFNFKIPKFELPTFKLPNFNIDINDLFGDFSKLLDTNILNGISSILTTITKALLELLNLLNKLDDFAFENMFPLPQINIPNGKTKFEAGFNQEWLIYIRYVYQLIIETDKQRTEPQIIKLPESLTKNEGIKRKISSRKIKVPLDKCEPLIDVNKLKQKSKSFKLKKDQSLQDIVENADIDNLIEKIKNFDHSDTTDYFKTENLEDEIVVDIMRFIAKSLQETSVSKKPKLPMTPQELIKSTSDMIEQIESILNQQELNSLLNGTYSNDTAEIVRSISRLNFPNLTYRVDPIKYFRMLGKVIGSTNIPK